MKSLSKEDKLLVESFLSFSKKCITNAEIYKWPILSSEVQPYFLKEFTHDFINELQKCMNNGYSLIEIAKSFHTSTTILKLTYHIYKGMEKSIISENNKIDIILKMLKMASYLKYGPILSESAPNIILSNSEIFDIIDSLEFVKSNHEFSKLFHRLCGLLWAYTESIYFAYHDLGCEIHGHYVLNNLGDKSILIRDFRQLNPSELWPHEELLNFDNIRLIAIYKNSVYTEFDPFNNPVVKYGNFVDSSHSFHIDVNGNQVNTNEMSDYCIYINNCISKQHKLISCFSKSMIVEKFAEIFWYRKKNIADLLNISWKPKKAIFKSIEKNISNNGI